MRQVLLPLALCLTILCGVPQGVFARECSWDVQCEDLYAEGSVCMENGQCSNPYLAGCLNNFYTTNARWNDESTPPKRVCNSDDATDDFCDPFPLNYTEIRVHNANWESSIFYSWILQIFLSEFLQVPSTIGLKTGDTEKFSFYNSESQLGYSSQAYAFEDFIIANEHDGHCLLTEENCAHVMPEVWIGQEKKWKKYLSEGHIDQPTGNGHVGKISWYIPVHTAETHPAVVSYHGMKGRREEIAAIFKRPTTWEDYCAEVSDDNCNTPDDVAKRAPEAGEQGMYFMDGVFTGHFRATEENDCSGNSTMCTGHIVGAPCSWSTYLDAQAYHNDIALESNGPLVENGGYSYGQMIQVWRAANATRSDVIMWWFTPDATIEEFRGTPYQFQQVSLPEPTNECRESRINPEDRCAIDPASRRGEPLGACDNESNSLQSLVASSLRDLTFLTPEVDRSPGYQAILNLKVSHLAMNVMLQNWIAGGRTGFAAREAVCSWVLENQEELRSFIPRGYPREFVDDNETYTVPMVYAAIAVGSVTVIYVLVVAFLVHLYSETKVFVFAQVQFIFMVLCGLLMVALASIFYALEPQNFTCISGQWLSTLGYTLELVPLLVKVAAINRLIAATKRMKRVRISLQSLFCTVASIFTMVVVLMLCWTILDPPQRTEGRFLTDDFEVVTAVTCSSESYIWSLVVLCWNGLLIVCATVLAFQSRTIKQEFNDSQSLGTMIYSHFVFAVLRAIVFNLGESGGSNGYGSMEPATIAATSSFLLSFDVITAITIYIMPKIATARQAPEQHYFDDEDVISMSLAHSVASRTATRSNGSRRSVTKNEIASSAKGMHRSIASMPSIIEGEEEPSSSDMDSSSRSGHIGHRVNMIGQTESLKEQDFVENIEDTSSDDDMDDGGPRFAGVQ